MCRTDESLLHSALSLCIVLISLVSSLLTCWLLLTLIASGSDLWFGLHSAMFMVFLSA